MNSIIKNSYSELDDYQNTLMDQLEEILSSKERIDEICKKSYCHSNGFVKIVLREFSDGRKLRLHIWNKNNDLKEDIHDHRWSFVSVPLFGTFVERKYTEVSLSHPKGKSMIKHICFPRKENEWLEVCSKEKIKLISSDKIFTRKPKIKYSCKRGEIHDLRLSSNIGATLVLTLGSETNCAKVYKTHALTSDMIKINLPNLTPKELKINLKLVRERA